ncbi:class I SAM-dependent methyltransferase, partial [bacterium]|nr:class I SAM-dependent methyltransferase [bacterium]
LGDLVGNLVFDFIYHEHISGFSVKPLALFFRRHGLELIHVLRVPTKGGSVRYTVQPVGGPRRVSASVGELLELEARQGLHEGATFARFSETVANAKRRTLDLLDRFAGRPLAAYGASATTTTLLYHFELGPRVAYLLDDYPAKQGLFSPGLHLPVLPSDALYERKPEAVVVMAWRYHEPIRRRHPRYAEQGGRWIVPLPEPKVLA